MSVVTFRPTNEIPVNGSKVKIPGDGLNSSLHKIIKSGLIESSANLVIKRKDPLSPLYSVKSFEELNLAPELLNGVYDMGFNQPSRIQETAVPTLMADPPQNMIAQSQSGTGKTAAFILAFLSRINPEEKYPQVLCLSPTYELALQTASVVAQMAKYTKITVRHAVRGEQLERNEKITEHVVIGTPGKVLDWAIKFGSFNLSKLKVFVLDEADIMIATQGHLDQCIRIHKKLSDSCQMMLFSATYEEDLMEFADTIINYPVIIRLRREEESLDNIKQFYIVCRNDRDKYEAIATIYGVVVIGQAIIFCQTRKTAVWLSDKMVGDGHTVAQLCGELTTEARNQTLEGFRTGDLKVLITTNVLSRGIDVEQVTVVVNFDLPLTYNKKADCDTYLHRIGRTGRFGKPGLAINLVCGDGDLRNLRIIEEHFGKRISPLDVDDVDEIEKIVE